MTTDDLPKFIEIWSNVQGMFNKVPSDQTLKLTFQSLADFKIEDIERALALTLRTSKFAPTIADVVEQIKRMYGVDDDVLKIKANKWYNALNDDIDSYADMTLELYLLLSNALTLFVSMAHIQQKVTHSTVRLLSTVT